MAYTTLIGLDAHNFQKEFYTISNSGLESSHTVSHTSSVGESIDIVE
jgi:hypothetical protein